MIKSKLLICAEGVVIDKKSNNASIFEILEQLSFSTLPVVFPKLVVFSAFERDEGDDEKWDGRLCISVAGSVILDNEIVHDFKGTMRSRNIITVGGLPITQPGKLEVSVRKDTEIFASYTLDVVAPIKATVERSEA